MEEASLFVHTDHPHRNERGSMLCINQTTIVSLAISIVLLPASGDKYYIFIYYIVYRVSFCDLLDIGDFISFLSVAYSLTRIDIFSREFLDAPLFWNIVIFEVKYNYMRIVSQFIIF